MGWRYTFGGTLRVLTDEERAALLEEDPYASRYEGGTAVDLDDLSPEVYDRIATAEGGGITWWNVYTFPAGGQTTRLHLVLVEAAKFAQVDIPAKPLNMGAFQRLMLPLEQTEPIQEDLPEGGLPTVPSETETVTSSGLSDDSGGSPPQ